MNLVLKLLGDDIRKPSALVHFEREMSPVEQKIMTLIIFHSQVMDSDDKGFYYIKKSFIRELLGWEESNNYPRIYQAFKSIFDNSVTWNFLGTDRTFQSLMCKLVVSLLKPTATGEGGAVPQNQRPYLLQTYQRDTGEVMHDLSVPIVVSGRHWGAFRIGYRSAR